MQLLLQELVKKLLLLVLTDGSPRNQLHLAIFLKQLKI